MGSITTPIQPCINLQKIQIKRFDNWQRIVYYIKQAIWKLELPNKLIIARLAEGKRKCHPIKPNVSDDWKVFNKLF